MVVISSSPCHACRCVSRVPLHGCRFASRVPFCVLPGRRLHHRVASSRRLVIALGILPLGIVSLGIVSLHGQASSSRTIVPFIVTK